jgi:hypothetical protein
LIFKTRFLSDSYYANKRTGTGLMEQNLQH